VIIHANLDCEARWAGITLPAAVLSRISLYGTLVSALGEGEIEIWTPAAVDPARVMLPWSVALRTGTPARVDLAWAEATARDANDRRLALFVAALPGSRAIRSVDEIDLSGSLVESWIVKLPWTAAGRDRCRGTGPPTPEQRTRIERLLAICGELVLEPWCDRILDVGVCATVDGTTHPPHRLLSDARGGFVGIELAPPELLPAELAQLDAAVSVARPVLAATGYRGPFAIDAFAYRLPNGERRFHPVCEINARYSFGWIARALHARLDTTRLGFGPAPDGARVVIAPGDDGVTAWIA
jgi:hypothetical protein